MCGAADRAGWQTKVITAANQQSKLYSQHTQNTNTHLYNYFNGPIRGIHGLYGLEQ